MYLDNRLAFLAPQFHPWVLGGGIGILIMVALRAVVIWKEAGQFQAQSDHVHGPDCQGDDCNHVHIPGQEDHSHADHGHSHDMSWVIARMLILVFPVALFFLGLPNSSFSAEAQLQKTGKDSAFGGDTLKDLAKDATQEGEVKNDDKGVYSRILKTKTGLTLKETTLATGETKLELVRGEHAVTMKFSELNDAAYDSGLRKSLQGQVVVLEGHFKRLADKEFALFRMKMTCCKADEVPLKVRIIVPQALSGVNDFAWVEVKGQIQFLKIPDQERYIPVLMVADISDVNKNKTAPVNESE
jgi:uncharacterized membrane protein YcgQ (UPF0703/DUF1980 family)